MTHDPNSFKKIAVLTGLTALIGGAEISNADAATITQTDNFNFSTSGSATATRDLPFNGFTAPGVLTSVEIQLISNVALSAMSSATATVRIFGNTFSSVPFSNATTSFVVEADNFGPVNGVSGSATLADYMGSNFDAVLTLTGGSAASGSVLWAGDESPEGLTVTYTYTPLPATLPLFVSGLAGLGFTTWRSRRKQTAKE